MLSSGSYAVSLTNPPGKRTLKMSMDCGQEEQPPLTVFEHWKTLLHVVAQVARWTRVTLIQHWSS